MPIGGEKPQANSHDCYLKIRTGKPLTRFSKRFELTSSWFSAYGWNEKDAALVAGSGNQPVEGSSSEFELEGTQFQ